MSRKHLIGDLPRILHGPNIGRMDRHKAAASIGLSVKEISKAYNNWIQIFRIPGSSLKFDEYLKKLNEANISINDLGNTCDKYHLSRFNDEGPYTKDSCRFIPMHMNRQEQKNESPYYRSVRKYGNLKASRIQSLNARGIKK